MTQTPARGLVLGFLADRALGDPQRYHPVAGFGTAAAALERRTYADARANGIVHVTILVGAAIVLGRVLPRRDLVTAAATWAVLGGTTLDREAAAVERYLLAQDVPGARTQVARLVGRDTSVLDASGIARAVIESIAENTSDAVVAPLFWGAVAGVPGLLAYRVANTLDAMIGHRSARYEQFGWAAARLDDVLNLPGSRLTALLATALGGDPGGSLRAWRRYAGAHPSPNAGPVEASFAGALGIQLGGTNVYGEPPDQRVEHRSVMGDGRDPVAQDVVSTRQLARRVQVGAIIVLAPIAALLGRRRRT